MARMVDIDLTIKESTSLLWLNATNLTVTEAGIQSQTAKVISTPKDYLGFSFSRPLEPGPARLHIVYEGKIGRKDSNGLFQMKDNDNWYAYTQFEPTDARKAFPCFDEPAYKVPWQVTLRVKKEHLAFANAPVLSESEAGGMKVVKFAETKPLPSYLVAFAVGPFDIVEAGKAGKKNTVVRILTPRGRAAEAGYAAEATPHILRLLEEYFAIPYPYEKLDQIAIPLVGFAMEHPGLVTYGQSTILSKPELDTLQRKRGFASVCAHELAHQWFGDLVTMQWWDDTWLNEGFASWMTTKIVDRFHPEWEVRVSGNRGALSGDSLVSARKVRQPIESSHDIANAFDGITYGKGAALLGMFESYLGPEEFQKGIRRYLNKYAWRNATSEDFLVALGGESNAEVSRAFSTFLEQAGAPLVTAELACDNRGARLKLEQQRYLPVGSNAPGEQTWRIPVCVKYGAGRNEARECAMLTGKTLEMPLRKAKGCPAWIFANVEGTGYYRIQYKGDLLQRLIEQDRKTLTVGERVALIGDLAAFSRGGQMGMGEALKLASKLARDSHRQVITSTLGIAAGVQSDWVPEELKPVYRRFLANTYAARARELKTKPGEEDEARLLRPSLLSVTAIAAQDGQLIEEAKKLALAWLDDRKAVDPDMMGLVLSTAARNGDRALFERFRAEAKKVKERRERQTLLGAMGSFRDPEILKTARSIALSDEFDVREAVPLLFAGAGDPRTRESAFLFIKENFDAIVAKLPTDFGAFLPFVASGFCDAGHRAEAEAFFKDRVTKFPGGPRNLSQALERMSQCIAAKEKQQPSLVEFLKSYTD
ncbi:MAG: M1 family metallopeptidase [Acidobacteria bacterium]|nr:M1 family metallopeptidase [Acidobacteriota bacterium]